eukprot:6473204-Amphidinium_carterae.1
MLHAVTSAAKRALIQLRVEQKRQTKCCHRRAMPGLVTILCDVECLGAWSSFWAPCRGTWPFASKLVVTVSFQTLEVGFRDELEELLECDLLSRSDVCRWRWPLNGRECMEATLEHLVWLLYP